MNADPLEGYRATDPADQLSPEEALLKRLMASNSNLIALVNRSQAVDQWFRSEAGKAVREAINVRLDEHMKVIMYADDPTSDAARDAHFGLRVCVGMLDLLGEIINAGPEARRAVEASQRAANMELSNNERYE